MPYDDLDDAIALANRGKGSLAGSLFTDDPAVARDVVLGAGAHHGRMLVLDRDDAKRIHRPRLAPARRSSMAAPAAPAAARRWAACAASCTYMQRTALQGSPDMLTAITGRWTKGPAPPRRTASTRSASASPSCGSATRSSPAPHRVTLEDIEHFAEFTGDTFYAHMDEAAAANPLFGGVVAHGYLVVSLAAGLFVDPDPGPVLANFGVDNLRFLTPVKPGDTMR